MQTITFQLSYKSAFAIYAFVIAFMFLPLILREEVICPFNNDIELGVSTDAREENYITNRKFCDYNYFFIPETEHNLHSNCRSWISVWSPWGEFGRPTTTCQGMFGKAYLLTNILSYITKSPYIFHTYYAILMIFLSGTFLFLFLREIALHSVACCSMAIAFSTCTFFFYWISFNIHLSTFCWTAALLWLITNYAKRLSFWSWFGVIFATYSLLMTGYQQVIIMSAYLLIFFSVFHIWGLSLKRSEKILRVSMLGLAACLGVIAALPLYLDIFAAAASSARLKVDDSFFVAVLPRLNGVNDSLKYLGLIFDPYMHGNPIASKDPRVFGGVSLTPVYFILLVLSFGISFKRRIWGWHLFIMICFFTTLWPPAYLMLVHYFGFNFSRIQTLCGALIPFFIVIGYQIDDLLKSSPIQQLPKRRFLLACLALVVFAVGVIVLILADGNTIDTYNTGQFSMIRVVFTVFLLTCFTMFVFTRHSWIFLILSIFTALMYAQPLLLKRPLSLIHTTSSIVEKMRDTLPKGERFAFAEPTGILPPNLESLIHLPSAHTYNSLSSLKFQKYISELGGEVAVYGRHANTIGKNVSERPAFSYSGIGLVLSRSPLEDPGLKQIGEESGLRFYKPLRDPILYAQVNDYTKVEDDKYFLDGYLFDHPSFSVSRLEYLDDYQKFKVTSCTSDTLLYISQQHHARWRATTDIGPAKITLINNFFLGVIVPAGAKWIELEFRPFVYWSFIPQIVFIGAFFVFLGNYICLRLRERSVTQ